MLDYTRAAATKIKRDVHAMSVLATVSAQLLSILSLTYILFKGEGIFALKLTLLVITVGYFAFYCATTAYTERRHKRLKRKVAFAFQWSRRAIKVVNLGIVIYGFVGAAHTPFSLLMFTFSALGVVLDIALGIISFIVEGWTQLVIEGVEYDVGKLVNTFKPANLFNKLLGKEEPEPELTPNQRILEKIVRQKKAEKAEKIAAVKSERLSAKQEKRLAKAQAKEARKQAKLAEKETAITSSDEE